MQFGRLLGVPICPCCGSPVTNPLMLPRGETRVDYLRQLEERLDRIERSTRRQELQTMRFGSRDYGRVQG